MLAFVEHMAEMRKRPASVPDHNSRPYRSLPEPPDLGPHSDQRSSLVAVASGKAAVLARKMAPLAVNSNSLEPVPVQDKPEAEGNTIDLVGKDSAGKAVHGLLVPESARVVFRQNVLDMKDFVSEARPPHIHSIELEVAPADGKVAVVAAAEGKRRPQQVIRCQK